MTSSLGDLKRIIAKLIGIKLIASLIGLVYSILQVRFFGASGIVDAFFISMAAVNMITSLVQHGQLAEAFLPEYLKHKAEKGNSGASDFLSVVLNRMVVFVGVGLICIFILSPHVIDIIGPGLKNDYKEICVALFRASLLLVLFTIISSFINTALNAEQVYGRTELSALINGIVSIILLAIFYRKLGVFILVYSLLAGKLVEFIIGIFLLRKIGFNYKLIWNLKNYNISHFFRILITTSGYVGATQIYSVTITAMASFLPTGSLSIFNYVLQLSNKASSIFMGPFSTVFFSKISNSVALGKENLERHLKSPLIGVFVINFLIFCYVLIIGKDLLHLIWSKRSLNEDQFQLAFFMLCLNLFGYIFTAIGNIFRKVVVAFGQARKLYRVWIFSQLSSALYAFIAIYYFGIFGLSSILFLNMLSMALVSFILSEKEGIRSKQIIVDLVVKEKFFIPVLVLILASVSILMLFNFLFLSSVISILIKVLLLTIIVCILQFFYFKNEVKETLLSFKRV